MIASHGRHAPYVRGGWCRGIRRSRWAWRLAACRPPCEDHRVAILQVFRRVSPLGSADGAAQQDFGDAGLGAIRRAGDGAAAQQIARQQVAAVRRVVRHHLRRGPVHPFWNGAVGDGARRGHGRRLQGRAHGRCCSPSGRLLVRCGGAGRRAGRAWRQGSVAKGASASAVTIQGADGGVQALAQEGAERRHFIALHVAHRPVVQQAEAEEAAGRPSPIGVGSPCAFSPAIQKPSSSSKSIAPVGAKTMSPSRKYWPQGRRTSLPEATHRTGAGMVGHGQMVEGRWQRILAGLRVAPRRWQWS